MLLIEYVEFCLKLPMSLYHRIHYRASQKTASSFTKLVRVAEQSKDARVSSFNNFQNLKTNQKKKNHIMT